MTGLQYDGCCLLPPRPGGRSAPGSWGSFPGWWAQPKMNGTRVCLYVDRTGRIDKFLTRRMDVVQGYRMPKTMEKEILEIEVPRPYVLDGELMHFKTREVKDILVFWDMLVCNGVHLIGTTYRERFEELHGHLDSPDTCSELGLFPYSKHVWLACNYLSAEQGWDKASGYDEIEGLMLKDPGGRLKPDTSVENNGAWQIRMRKETKAYQF